MPGRHAGFRLPPSVLAERQTDVRSDEQGEDDSNHDEDSSRRKDRFWERGDGVAVYHPENDRLMDR